MAPLFVPALRRGVDVHDKLTRSRSWQPSAAPTVPWQRSQLKSKSPYCLASLKHAQLSDILTFSFGDVCQKKAKGPRTERIEVASLPVLLPVRYTVGSAAPGPHLSV